MTALQAEKERLMRSVSEKEAELSSLRQSALAEQSSLQVEREKSSRDLGNLQSMLQEKVSQLAPAGKSPAKSGLWRVQPSLPCWRVQPSLPWWRVQPELPWWRVQPSLAYPGGGSNLA